MLVNNTIEVYDFSIAADPAQYDRRAQLLSADEIERARRFKFDHHRMRWVNCRAALRTILSSHLDLAPENLVFSLQKNGKPTVKGLVSSELARPDSDQQQPLRLLHFNLSHSSERGLIAVCKNLEIGCDVEHVKRVSDWPAVTKRFFSTAEQQELDAVAPPLRELAFFLGWTRKEAVIKATGEGLHAELAAFDVSLTPGEQASVKAHRHASQVNAHWHLRHFEPHADYVAAVAVDSRVEPDFVFYPNWSIGQ